MTPARRAALRKGSRSARPLALRRRVTPKQPRKVRRRVAKRAVSKPRAAKKAVRKVAAKPTTGKPRAAKGATPTRAPAAEQPGGSALPPGKLRIAVFGAGGTLGSRIAAEAVARGHQVTPVQRTSGFVKLGAHRVGVRRADALDPASVAAVAKGHDAVVSAVGHPPERPDLLVRAARGLVAGCRAAHVPRLIVVNGAGSLLVPPVDPLADAMQLLDAPDFPAAWRPTALAHREALAYLRDAGTGLQWTAVSPPALIQPGVRTGRYQIGTERLLRGRDGHSRISAEDYAMAVVDELEKGRFKGKRMTVAWP